MYRLTPARMGGAILPRSEGKGFTVVDDEGKREVRIHPAFLNSPSLAMSSMGFTPLPNRLQAKLKYVAYASLTSGVTPGVNVYSANGLYDPDITGSGHQPRGFDQLIALYDHYVVLRSKCVVHFAGALAASVNGIQLQASSTPQSDYIDYAEQARCEFSLSPWCYSTGGFPEPRSHTLQFEASKFMGIPDPVTAGKLQGSVSSNPSDQGFFHVFTQHIDGSTSASQNVLVFLEYDVVFIEPVPVASS
jgi:hypothetical protein